MNAQSSQAEIASLVRAVFDELDMQQLAISGRLSGAQRIRQAFDLCDWAQSLIIASIRSHHPGISDAELRERLRLRVSGSSAPRNVGKYLFTASLAGATDGQRING